jgi:hypothetical protein
MADNKVDHRDRIEQPFLDPVYLGESGVDQLGHLDLGGKQLDVRCLYIIVVAATLCCNKLSWRVCKDINVIILSSQRWFAVKFYQNDVCIVMAVFAN